MDAPVEMLSSTDPMSAILMTFLIGISISIYSASAYPISSTIPSVHDPCRGSPEAVRVGFNGERILFGGGSFSCKRSTSNNQGSLVNGFAAALVMFVILLCAPFYKMLLFSLSKIALPILYTFYFGYVLYRILLLFTMLIAYVVTIFLQLPLVGLGVFWKLCVFGFEIFTALPFPGLSLSACRDHFESDVARDEQAHGIPGGSLKNDLRRSC